MFMVEPPPIGWPHPFRSSFAVVPASATWGHVDLMHGQ